MYSPTTRLLTVLELLQSYPQITGAEIARRLEVDPRTVRRYITMLQDMGIPVAAQRGPLGAYQLERGYKLPPLMFNEAEAVALVLGLIAIRALGFPVDVAAQEGALAKTERMLPAHLLAQTRALQEAITFYAATPPVLPANAWVAVLSAAVSRRTQLMLHYRALDGATTERAFDPYGIVCNAGYWYTAGYCHLRQAVRTFRLDRIVALEPTGQRFERPADFDPLAHVLEAVARMPGTPPVTVLLHTSLERARQAIPPVLATLEENDQGVILRRGAHQLEWLAHVLLTLDFPVTVIEPDALRDLLRALAAKASALAGGTQTAPPPPGGFSRAEGDAERSEA